MNNFEKVNNYDDFKLLIKYMISVEIKDIRKMQYQNHHNKYNTNSLLDSKKTIILECVKDFFQSEINKCDNLAKQKPVSIESQEYILNFVNSVNNLFDAFKTHDFKTDFLELAIPDCSREVSEIIFSNPEELKKWISFKLEKLDIACKQYYDFSESNRFFIDKLIDNPIIKSTLNINRQISFDIKNPEHILLQFQANKEKKHKYLELAIIVNEIRSYKEIEDNERVAVFLTSIIYSDILQALPKENEYYKEIYEIKKEFFENNLSSKTINERNAFYQRISDLSSKFSLGINVSTYEHDAELKNISEKLSLNSIGISNDTVDSMTIMLFGKDLHIVNHHSTKNSTNNSSNKQAYRGFMAVKNDLQKNDSLIKKIIKKKFDLNIDELNVKHSSLQIISDGIIELPQNIFSNPHYQTKNVLNTLGYFADTLLYSSGVHLETQMSEKPVSIKEILKLFLECIRDVRRDANYNEYIENLIKKNMDGENINGYNVIIDVLYNSLEIFKENFINKDVLTENKIRSANTDKFSNIFGKPLFTLITMMHSSELNDYNNDILYSLIIKNVKQINALARLTGIQETKDFNFLLAEIASKYLCYSEFEKSKIQGGNITEELLNKIEKIEIPDFSNNFSINTLKPSECVELDSLTIEQCTDFHKRIWKTANDMNLIKELNELGDLIINQFYEGVIPRYRGQGGVKPKGMLNDLKKLWKYSIQERAKGNTPSFKEFKNSVNKNRSYIDEDNNLHNIIQFTQTGKVNKNSINLEKIMVILGLQVTKFDLLKNLKNKNSM